jgi:hypothetical protein
MKKISLILLIGLIIFLILGVGSLFIFGLVVLIVLFINKSPSAPSEITKYHNHINMGNYTYAIEILMTIINTYEESNDTVSIELKYEIDKSWLSYIFPTYLDKKKKDIIDKYIGDGLLYNNDNRYKLVSLYHKIIVDSVKKYEFKKIIPYIKHGIEFIREYTEYNKIDETERKYVKNKYEEIKKLIIDTTGITYEIIRLKEYSKNPATYRIEFVKSIISHHEDIDLKDGKNLEYIFIDIFYHNPITLRSAIFDHNMGKDEKYHLKYNDLTDAIMYLLNKSISDKNDINTSWKYWINGLKLLYIHSEHETVDKTYKETVKNFMTQFKDRVINIYDENDYGYKRFSKEFEKLK